MNKTEIEEKVKSIVAEICEVDLSEITVDSTIGDFANWDSVGHLTILSTCEETFGISFEPEEMMELEDVNTIVAAIETKI